MIAVTFALPAESSGFLRALANRTREIRDGAPRYTATCHSHEVIVLHTGVGEKMTRARIEAFFIERPAPQCLISAGFAGALGDELQISDLLLADNFSDERLLAAAQEALREQRPKIAKLASTNRVLDSAVERRQFAEQTGAQAVDMETQTLAELCAQHSIPLLSLRVVTDTPSAPFPAPPEVLFDPATQRTNALRLASYLLLRPAAIGRLLIFAQRINAARGKLTAALDLLLGAPLP